MMEAEAESLPSDRRGRECDYERDVLAVHSPLAFTIVALSVLYPLLDLWMGWTMFSSIMMLGFGLIASCLSCILFTQPLPRCKTEFPFEMDPSGMTENRNKRVIIGHRGCVAVAIEKKDTNNKKEEKKEKKHLKNVMDERKENDSKSLLLSSSVKRTEESSKEECAFIPENSLRAFEYALDHGCRGFEFDVRFTKDGYPVVFHDYHIRKLTNFKQVLNRLQRAKKQKCDPDSDYYYYNKKITQLLNELRLSKGEIHKLKLNQLLAFQWDTALNEDMFDHSTGLMKPEFQSLMMMMDDDDPSQLTMIEEEEDSMDGLLDIRSDEDDGELFDNEHCVDLMKPWPNQRDRLVSLNELCEWFANEMRRRQDYNLCLFLELKHLPHSFDKKHAESIIKSLLNHSLIKLDQNVVIISFSSRIIYSMKKYLQSLKLSVSVMESHVRCQQMKEQARLLGNNNNNMTDYTMVDVIHTGLIYERHAYHGYCTADHNLIQGGRLLSLFKVWIWWDPIYSLLKRWLLPQWLGVSVVGYPSWLVSEHLSNYFARTHGIRTFVWGANSPIDVAYQARHGVVCVVDNPSRHGLI